MKRYCVKYKMNGSWDKEKSICIIANNKAQAYDIAIYEIIPEVDLYYPYSAWVESVTYSNDNVKYFNTSEGNPY